MNRREFLHRSGVSASVGVAAGVSSLPCTAAGGSVGDEPTNALFNAEEAETLGLFAELLVPGAQAAGIVDFVGSQLAGAQADSLLMLRYLAVPLDQFAGFYQAGLAACSALAKAEFPAKRWSQLTLKQRQQLVSIISTDSAKEWLGPPSSFFQFVVRADACDVVYGTRGGFERLAIPHMAHIDPPSEW